MNTIFQQINYKSKSYDISVTLTLEKFAPFPLWEVHYRSIGSDSPEYTMLGKPRITKPSVKSIVKRLGIDEREIIKVSFYKLY